MTDTPDASPAERGVVRPGTQNTGTANAGNPGVLVGTRDVGGQRYAQYKATEGTWVSASMQQQGWASVYGPDTAYGAHTGIVRSPDGTALAAPDRIRPGQEYLVPLARQAASPVAEPSPPVVQPATSAQTADPQGVRALEGRYGATDVARGPTDAAHTFDPMLGLLGSAPRLAPTPPPEVPPEVPPGPYLTLLRGGATGETAVGIAARLGGLARAAVPVAAAAAAAYLSVTWAFDRWHEVHRLALEADEQRQDAEREQWWARVHLQQQAFIMWQNGEMTEEEYFLFMTTGAVGRPERPQSPEAIAADKKAARAAWFRVMWLGYLYNLLHRFDTPFTEVHVESGTPGVFNRVDGYDPVTGRILERKNTQFAAISLATGLSYLRETFAKYHPGTRIANTPKNKELREVGPAGKRLKGVIELRIPVQLKPIPKRILVEAKKLDIRIIDDLDNEFTLKGDQRTKGKIPIEEVDPTALPTVPPPQPAPKGPRYITITQEDVALTETEQAELQALDDAFGVKDE
ncbi:hypothetical protein [Cellulomonas sp. ICMP 17802]|uniref:hypothetical protein n=1 Tax=Cellulomonas sp. ICMP 17802 TaxID=3239199 RepID=UPI00351AC0A8